MSRDFCCKIEIDVFGVSSPEEAAKAAWKQLTELNEMLPVVDVTDTAGELTRVDLQELLENDSTPDDPH